MRHHGEPIPPRVLLAEVYDPRDIHDLWHGFFSAHGREAMEECYGWDEAPPDLRRGETLLAVSGHMGETVGWASLIPKAQDGATVELALGVWPAWKGLGLRREILLASSAWAFENMGADFVFVDVLDSNKGQQEKYMRDSLGGFPFRFCGRDWWPVGSKRFGWYKPE